MFGSGDPGVLNAQKEDRQKMEQLLKALDKEMTFFGPKETNNAPVNTSDVFKLNNSKSTRMASAAKRYRESADYSLVAPRSATSKMKPLIGGTPMDIETATALRKLLIGSTVHSLSQDWKRAGMMFQNGSGPFAYGINTYKNGTRGLSLCIQAHILKRLLFKNEDIHDRDPFDQSILQPANWKRKQSMISALCDMLWQAGSQRRCYITLISDRICFEPTHEYKADGITEWLHIFEFKNYEDLEMFVKRYLTYFEFESTHGLLLFLYSLVLSRTIEKVIDDMGDQKHPQLLTDYEECTRSLINLALNGKAVTYFHNGDIVYDDDGKVLSKPLKGVKQRNEVGLLLMNTRDEDDREKVEVGSMLKTPRFPIWVTLINHQYGLLFSVNPDLVSDWRVEHKFQLHYYTGLPTQTRATLLNVDTRFNRHSTAKTLLQKSAEEKKIPALERCIMSKWYGAQVNWNGTMPYY